MIRTRHFRRWALAGLLGAGSLRCGGDTLEPPAALVIAMVAGNGQSGPLGQQLPEPLVVRVLDLDDAPVAGVTVRWSAQDGGSVSAESVETGSDGRASVEWLLGSSPGEQTATAEATGLEGSPITFAATAVASAGNVLLITTSPPVSALDGEVFDPSVQPVVQLKNASGDPVEGGEVDATLASGSGTLEGTTSATTDADGFARFGDIGIRGTGSHVLEFTAGAVSVTSSPVDVAPLPSEASTGKWGQVVNWDIVPLHMNLLPNGKILAWGKADAADTMGMPRLWDPASGSPSGLPMIQVDTMLFCAGHVLMPDGRLMVAGGHLKNAYGIATTFFFDADGSPVRGPDMAHGRWYPTLTMLPDERILSMGGRDEQGQVVTTPEIWQNGQWKTLPGAGTVNIPYYPRNFVPPNGPPGRIFYAGERVQSRWFDVDANGGEGAWSSGPSHIWPYNREYGTAVMYEPGKILYAGGGGDQSWGETPDARASAPTATAETIDLDLTAPTWQNTDPMQFARRHHTATILPDGQVLVTGGTSAAGFNTLSGAVHAAEAWNPQTGDWTELAANTIDRAYHSVSLLLPDGTVLHGASGDATIPGTTTPYTARKNHEIFSPPYLFKGARPTITGAPNGVTWGQTFTVTTPNAGQVTDARWIRLGSVTHAFDMGQQASTLAFSRTATGVEIIGPANSNLAPPGYYMLFILNRNGVPSEGRIIRVQ